MRRARASFAVLLIQCHAAAFQRTQSDVYLIVSHSRRWDRPNRQVVFSVYRGWLIQESIGNKAKVALQLYTGESCAAYKPPSGPTERSPLQHRTNTSNLSETDSPDPSGTGHRLLCCAGHGLFGLTLHNASPAFCSHL